MWREIKRSSSFNDRCIGKKPCIFDTCTGWTATGCQNTEHDSRRFSKAMDFCQRLNKNAEKEGV